MAKLFLKEIPSGTEAQTHLSTHYAVPVDPLTFETYLQFRKLNAEIDIILDELFSEYNLSTGRYISLKALTGVIITTYHSGLLLTDEILLMILQSNNDGFMPSELAQKVGVTQATISGLISNLEKSGLLQRHTHHQDGRAFVIKLTEQGQQLLAKLTPDFFHRIHQFLGGLTDEEKNNLNQICQKLLGVVSIMSKSLNN